MRVALDARSLFGGGTGDRTYFRDLIVHMAQLAPGDTFTLYHREADAERASLAARYGNVATAALSFPVGWLWSPLALPPRLRRDRMDVLHAQYLLPPLAPCPTVVTIHDITFRLFPHWFSRRARRIMNLLIPLAARTAARILTGSECARQDIIRCFKVPPDKVIVTPYGVSSWFQPVPLEEARARIAERYNGLAPPYILGVGVRGVRKNIGVVLRAVLRLQEEGRWPSAARIALAGNREQFPDPEVAELRDSVAFLGYVPDDALPALYAAATACVYPSLYEGFGLPPLEAMACGCPVLSSNTSSLPEVVGDAGWLLAPSDESVWANALARIFSDESLRAELRQKGLRRAQQFSWECTARRTLEVYRELTMPGGERKTAVA